MGSTTLDCRLQPYALQARAGPFLLGQGLLWGLLYLERQFGSLNNSGSGNRLAFKSFLYHVASGEIFGLSEALLPHLDHNTSLVHFFFV